MIYLKQYETETEWNAAKEQFPYPTFTWIETGDQHKYMSMWVIITDTVAIDALAECGITADSTSGMYSLADIAEITNFQDFAPLSCDSPWDGDETLTNADWLKYFSGVTDLDSGEFQGCTSMTSAVLSNAVSILGNVFMGCTALETVVLPETISHLGDALFKNCTYLEMSSMPSSVTHIGDSTFLNCKTITLNDLDNVSELDKNSFSGCTGLTTMSGSNVKKIPEMAFKGCNKMTTVSFPIVEEIDTQAFYNCTKLTSNIGTAFPSLKRIGTSAFGNCSALTAVQIPETVEDISGNPFITTKKITAFTVDSQNPYYYSDNSSTMIIERQSQKLVCLAQNATDKTIPATVKEIGEYACANNQSTSITFADCKLTKVGTYAFQAYKKTFDTSIFNTVREIGDYAFMSCSNWTPETLNLPNIVKIGRNAFGSWSSVTKLIIGNKCKEIGTTPFEKSYTVTTVVCYATVPPVIDGNTFNSAARAVIEAVYVPDESLEAYSRATGWKKFAQAEKLFGLSKYEE